MNRRDVPQRRAIHPDELRRLEHAAGLVFGRDPEVLAVYLYGSAARGEPARDLDVAVLFRRKPPPPRRLEELAAALQRSGAPRGPEIDLRVLNEAGPRFWTNVLTDACVLYEADRDRRLEQEAMAMSRWLDFAPIWRRMRLRMLERWTNG